MVKLKVVTGDLRNTKFKYGFPWNSSMVYGGLVRPSFLKSEDSKYGFMRLERQMSAWLLRRLKQNAT